MRSILIPFILVLSITIDTDAYGGDPACQALGELLHAADADGPAVGGAVVRDGVVECEGVTGGREPGGSAIDRHSPFYIASLAKPITASAILRLAAEGEISLDDPVRRFVSELPATYDSVTLRHLLRHESGTPDHFDHLPPERIDGLSNDQVLAFLRERPLEHEPGSTWSYSNSGYVLLAEVVERVTDQAFEAWIEAHVFEPFGMRDASIGKPPVSAVRGFERDENDEWQPTPVAPRTVGPGGIYASLSDLEAWFLALRRGDAIPAEYLVQAIAPTLTGPGKLTPFTIAFQVEDLRRGLYYAGSFGILGGNHHTFMWLPDRDAAIIVLAARPDLPPASIIKGLQPPSEPKR